MGLKTCVYRLLRPFDQMGLVCASRFRYALDPVQYLRDRGARIGSGCRIYTRIICTEPYLISLGDHVSIGLGVELLTHEGAVWVLRGLERNPDLDLFGPIRIGSNVFVGDGAKLMPGVTVGDNVIIGANSVVTECLASDGVYAGAPARQVSTLENFRRRRLAHCIQTKSCNWVEKKQRILEHMECHGDAPVPSVVPDS